MPSVKPARVLEISVDYKLIFILGYGRTDDGRQDDFQIAVILKLVDSEHYIFLEIPNEQVA